MAVIKLANEFTLEVSDEQGDVTYLKGTLRDFTKKEQQEFAWLSDKVSEARKIIFKTNMYEAKLELLNSKLEVSSTKEKQAIISEMEHINEELYSIRVSGLDSFSQTDEEDVASKRLDVCLGGKNREEILELAKKIGSSTLVRVIQEAINEDREKK